MCCAVGPESADIKLTPPGEARLLDDRLGRASGAYFVEPPTDGDFANRGTGAGCDERDVFQRGWHG